MKNNKTAVLMPSVTHAISAKRLFEALGYGCLYKKTVNVSKNGCSHYILVNTDPDTAAAIMEKYAVTHGDITEEAVIGS